MSVPSPGGRATARTRAYRHDALLYDDEDHLVRVAAPFLLDGLAVGDAAVVAASPRVAAVVREAVGPHPLLHVLERHDAYRARTPSAITTFRGLAEQYAGTGVPQVRVIGEVDFGATPRDWVEWQRYESVINEALADWPL